MDGKCPVYCLDDGAILNNLSHRENSISEVAEKCVPLVLKFAAAYGRQCGNWASNDHNREDVNHRSVYLGGWSYGGVVASVVAEKLALMSIRDTLISVCVKGLVLFDAPVRLAVSGHSADNIMQAEDKSVLAHFDYCTSLLRKHYVRPIVETPILHCPLLDIRAEQSSYDTCHNAVCELTTGDIQRHKCAGDHFSMIVGSNAQGVARLLNDFVAGES